MHSVRLEPTKLILIGTRTTYQATGDAGGLGTINSMREQKISKMPKVKVVKEHIPYHTTKQKHNNSKTGHTGENENNRILVRGNKETKHTINSQHVQRQWGQDRRTQEDERNCSAHYSSQYPGREELVRKGEDLGEHEIMQIKIGHVHIRRGPTRRNMSAISRPHRFYPKTSQRYL